MVYGQVSKFHLGIGDTGVTIRFLDCDIVN